MNDLFSTDSISGGIWPVESIDNHPKAKIDRWSIKKAVSDTEEVSCHVVGWELTYGEGRVSSDIVAAEKFSSASVTEGNFIGRVLTRSGRYYYLSDGSGHNMDAEYVWNSFKRINSISSFTEISLEELIEFLGPNTTKTDEANKNEIRED